MDFLKKHSHYIVAGILLLFFILSLTVASKESMIFDEKAHIPAGFSYVRYGDMRLNPEHPPLIKDLAGLPLLALKLSFPLQSKEWQSGINEQWAIGDMFVNCAHPDMICNDADAILFWSRLPIILISVLLGIAIFVWTRELSGTLAGLFALVLYAADPNIIAHNHYVTTDIGIAAFVFFAFYFFVRFLKNPNLENVVVAGIFLGLAELAKFSAVLLFPIFGLFVILYALTKSQPQGNNQSALSFKTRALLIYGFKFSGSVLVCFALIWSLYTFNTFNMPAEKTIQNANQVFAGSASLQILARNIIGTLSHSEFLRPLSHYFLGVFMVFARVAGGNTHYFLGVVSEQASRWYFPVVFLLKETLPFLFLLVAVLCYALTHTIKVIANRKMSPSSSYFSAFAHSFQNKPEQYLIIFFVLFYSYISIAGNLTIGFRHLFPILPFLYMLVAKTIFDFLKRREGEPVTHTAFSWMLGSLTFVIVAIPALTYPHYLSYFNPVTGGNENGYQYVTDSNYDWGQDLKNLNAFIKLHNNCQAGTADFDESQCALTKEYPAINQMRVDYFGGGSPSYYLKEKFIPWNDQREPEAGWYAISSFFYQESLYKKRPPGERNYKWLRAITPVTRAGDSIFIYYISDIK
jgi:4-amino-4-deoxy-L-arabinose transferase-like glycosyltransferase